MQIRRKKLAKEMINVSRFFPSNPAYTPTGDEPKALFDWRRMKQAMKICLKTNKSSPTDREKLYNTLQRLYKLIVGRGGETELTWFNNFVPKFCKLIKKSAPEFRGWLTEEEIEEYLTK